MPLTSIFLRLRLCGLTQVAWQQALFLHLGHWNDSNGWQWIRGVCWVAGGVMGGRECDERERVNTGIQYYWVFVSWENNALLKTHSIFKCHSLRSFLRVKFDLEGQGQSIPKSVEKLIKLSWIFWAKHDDSSLHSSWVMALTSRKFSKIKLSS